MINNNNNHDNNNKNVQSSEFIGYDYTVSGKNKKKMSYK